jgi:hypothetical protein
MAQAVISTAAAQTAASLAVRAERMEWDKGLPFFVIGTNANVSSGQKDKKLDPLGMVLLLQRNTV